MTKIQQGHRFITLVLIAILMLLQAAQTQTIPPLEPASTAYQAIAILNNKPNIIRTNLDTIRYPWAEYSKGALGNALWRTVYLLPVDEVRLPGLIHFPASSSDQTKAELDYLLQLQHSRTPQEINRAEYIAQIGSWPNILNPTDPDFEANRQHLFYILNSVTGKETDYKKYPATTQLLMNCIQDIRATEFRLKEYFKRPRPYHIESRLQPLARINSPSFPSGHSLWSYTEAYIFSELFPDKRKEFINTAAEVRWSRELMGIHYPSDNEASRIIGWYLLKYWYNNPKFMEDLNKAKAEWRNQ